MLKPGGKVVWGLLVASQLPSPALHLPIPCIPAREELNKLPLTDTTVLLSNHKRSIKEINCM